MRVKVKPDECFVIITAKGTAECHIPLQDEANGATEGAVVVGILSMILQDRELYESLKEKFFSMVKNTPRLTSRRVAKG